MWQFDGVIPELPVSDVDTALEYYRDVLGFSVEGRHVDESGTVVFGSVLCGGANLYFSRSDSPHDVCRCWIHANDVDSLAHFAGERGARITENVEDKPWGYRQFTVRDPDGHQLTFFQFGEGAAQPA
jgi:uncharacterized glyoxalase superfamily protein PhnB